MFENSTLIIRPDGTCHSPGIDYGPKPPQLKYKAGRFIVVKTPGHTGWSGRGEQSYYGTEYHLLEYDEATHKIVRVIEKREPGRGWREALVVLKNRADELNESS